MRRLRLSSCSHLAWQLCHSSLTCELPTVFKVAHLHLLLLHCAVRGAGHRSAALAAALPRETAASAPVRRACDTWWPRWPVVQGYCCVAFPWLGSPESHHRECQVRKPSISFTGWTWWDTWCRNLETPLQGRCIAAGYGEIYARGNCSCNVTEFHL